MRLFIFEPHKEWSYCGGALVVVANSFERAVALLMEVPNYNGSEKKFEGHTFVPMGKTYHSKSDWYVDVWMLTHVFEVGDAYKEEVIVQNYNYA